MSSLATPVVFIIFNRPELTQLVFNAISQAQPKQLFIIADGARFPEEMEKCQKARDIIKQVNWNCEVLTNFSDINMGCGVRISSGLDWVFSQVEEAIILEDDCLPTPSFFTFCHELLQKYKYDERIMHISANNFQDGYSRSQYSYYFSKYNNSWGWASWKRAWKYFNFEMNGWQEFKDAGMMKFICDNEYEEKYWTDIFQRMWSQQPRDIWDYMWTYTCWSQSGLSIIPEVNLVSNIGFGADATHTNGDSKFANLSRNEIDKIYHPHFVVKHKEADMYIFDYVFGGKAMKESDTIYSKVRKQGSNAKQYLKNQFRVIFHDHP
jgi:hypothetical protein